ncbi:unnamed protein product [Darwinula stevensoni]|uniref:Alpha-mannosidase n=1 Tax=Darwinula stevensoni TaxID=69355 RepID=A0A7R9AEB8_9CRUS|nr:unnamed protein product [Darwinula stevensoni]CAG0902213.1 unnamed protein product [Darwinula stevensoni]
MRIRENSFLQEIIDLMKKLDRVDERMKRYESDVRSLQSQIPELLKIGDSGSIFPGQDKDTGTASGTGNQESPEAFAADIAEGECSFARDDPSALLDLYRQIPFDNPDGGVWKQGWDLQYNASQWKTKTLRVFVVPHSHNDPGWIKTFEEYFQTQTLGILDSMAAKLEEHKEMTMIWAEVSFFSLWWNQASDAQKQQIISHVSNKKLEFVLGGWVMNDEANTHYFAMIQQMIEGHEWLANHLGIMPKNGWAIDPFGLSPTMAYLLRRMGFTAMVIQRVHYAVKKQLALKKQLEFRWQQAWDFVTSAVHVNREPCLADSEGKDGILTHLMPFYSYDVPHTCGPDPKVCCQFDFARTATRFGCPWRVNPTAVSPANVKEKAGLLLDQYRKKAQLFRTNTLLVQLGDDFRYATPQEWDLQFSNYQKIFEYFASHPELHVQVRKGCLRVVAQFGTLEDYFTALSDEIQEEDLPSLSGDFFTYNDRGDHYWSGYYTSRPFHKHLDRVLEHHLRGAEILYSLALAHAGSTVPDWMEKVLPGLVEARRSIALFQHHDGITGTGRDHVVMDYAQKLLAAFNKLSGIIASCSDYLLRKDREHFDGKALLQLDEARSEVSLPKYKVLDSEAVTPDLGATVVLFNPLVHRRREIVAIRTLTPDVSVYKAVEDELEEVEIQISPVFEKEDGFTISFLADLPPLSLGTYHFKTSPEANEDGMAMATISVMNYEPVPDTLYIHLKEEGLDVDVKIEFVHYGTSATADRNSGAYLFLPQGPARPVVIDEGTPVTVVRGPHMSSVTVTARDFQHTVTLKTSPGLDGLGLEINNLVDIKLNMDYELAMRISSNIKSGNTFYTDLNGFQVLKRETLLDKIPIQGNFYPMPTMAFVEDPDYRLTLLTRQPLGVGSLASGQLEVMQDRRFSRDDNRGLGQGVKDNRPTRLSFSLLLEKRVSGEVPISEEQVMGFPSLSAQLASQSLIYPIFRLLPTSPTVVPRHVTYAPMQNEDALPCDIHMVNLRTMIHETPLKPSNASAIILHRLGFNCDFKSPPVKCSTKHGQVDLNEVFPHVFQSEAQEASLSLMYRGEPFNKATPISLDPMEIYSVLLFR